VVAQKFKELKMKAIENKIKQLKNLDIQIEYLNYEKAKLEKEISSDDENDADELSMWLNYTFESSSGLTEEFADFYKDVKKYINQQCSNKFEIVLNRNHFDFSGFLKNKKTGKFVYFSASDVRHFQDDWYNSLLIRTASDQSDYTGGNNNFISIEQLREKALNLTE
jgi:hypothetical protein